MTNDLPDNPLWEPGTRARRPDPCVFVIFGGSGDLAHRKLIPGLYSLAADGLLPASFAVVGIGRRPMDDETFRASLRESVGKYARRAPLDEAVWHSLAPRLHYHQGDIADDDSYKRLETLLKRLDAEHNTLGNRLYYLATLPENFPDAVRGLDRNGLVHKGARGAAAWSRIVIEKPFGRDLASAQALNRTVLAHFHEDQVYRIDHYLGKETVQNLLVFRFANGIFEPLWNQKYIDHVQINGAESIGVETRGAFFDHAGILRDMVQSHILQVLSLVAMEPPVSTDATAVRDEKTKALRVVRAITPEDAHCCVVRGQYAEGFVGGASVPAYRQEAGVAPDSNTETFVALKLYLDNWRWSGVPFYIRSGKRLPKRATEIVVQFKNAPHALFRDTDTPVYPNLLIMRIQPDEGISLRMSCKIPGPQISIEPVRMDFQYGTSFGVEAPEAYERLLLDAMSGDSTLFTRTDAIEALWRICDPILTSWQLPEAPPPAMYAAGEWGPAEADQLIEADGRQWHRM